jgi:hypothetical protein
LETCLFCNCEENFNRNPGTEYICGSCVQLLFGVNQDDLNRAHNLATNKGHVSKAKAIESFLIPEGHNKQRKPESKFRININRKRIARHSRNKKERVRLATV